jgi:glycosyltransferase involved in cell wall biosynthesis
MLGLPKPITILYHHRTRAKDGQSVHIDEMIESFRGLGHSVVVVEPRRVEATTTSIESKLLPRALYELVELGYSLLEFTKLAVAVTRHRPDFLYERGNLFMLSGLWTSRVFGIPYLLEVNAPLAEERARYGGLFWQKLAAWSEYTCWRSASAVLPVTDVLGDYVRRQGVPERRIVVTPNGVNPIRFFKRDNMEAKRTLGLEHYMVLGFVGYIREWHGLDRVIEILAKRDALKNSYLLIVGDGPARAALEAQANSLGVADRVRITGTMPRKKLSSLIAAFDIALQPEVTPYASPLKLFEYMAQARTIVAPATSNIMEILEDQKDCLLYSPSNPNGLAEVIDQLASDGELRERLGNAAAKKILDRDLTWEGNARRVVQLAKRLKSESEP